MNIRSILYGISVCAFLAVGISENKAFAQQETPSKDLSAELGNKYFDALDYLLKNTWMADTLIKQRIQPAFAYGIVFPGLIKFSAIRNIMETGATRTLYVQSGRKYAHYEMGRFQMKPSFAELVERTVTRQKITTEKFDLKNTAKARGERARRLDSQEWQLKYLVMFIRIMDKRFAHIKWKSDDDKVRFYATAYSVGFNRDERTIKRMMNPHTVWRKSKEANSRVRCGDIAQWFFVNDGYRFKVDF